MGFGEVWIVWYIVGVFKIGVIVIVTETGKCFERLRVL